jgi:heavy metal sensor kinase
MLLALSLFASGMYIAIRVAVSQAADRDLHLRLKGAEDFLRRHVSQPDDRLQRELREHAGMRPGGEWLQIGRTDGRFLLRPDAMRQLGIPLGQPHPGVPSSKVISIRGEPIELLTEWLDIGGQLYGFEAAASMAQAFAILRGIAWLLLGCVPAMVAFACMGGYAISRRALRPIGRITEEARLITAERLSKRLDVPEAQDEIRSLSLTLNEMIDRLQQSFGKIQSFTADASHELRTPVSLIRSTAELALMELRDEQSYRAALQDNLEEAKRMTTLIEDLLTLARADSGAYARLPLRENDLTELLKAAFQTATSRLQRSGTVRLDIPESPLPVRCDPPALVRLFLILIDNALKYTPGGDWISVSARSCSRYAEVEISDSGIGISAEDLPHIFERFYRADKARPYNSGTGLGLSIAKCIADAHGAEIEVKSTPGKGSAFRVRFRSES